MTAKRALVVDDDRSMVRTLTDVLKLKGWEVANAYSGTEAVEAVTHGSFSVVLMDVRMPGMDGVSAFKVMKQRRPDLRVVLMTAYAAQDLLADAEREGVLRVMPKPVDVSALLSLLTASLSRQRPILLVDHDAAFLLSLNEVLRLRGFNTEVAEDLDQATKLMNDRRPAAVLLHLNLGKRSPREVVTVVHEKGPASALIVYSGQPDAQDAVGAVPSEWIRAFLQKPFAVDQVTRVLDGISASDG